jgi:hypothetical protein
MLNCGLSSKSWISSSILSCLMIYSSGWSKSLALGVLLRDFCLVHIRYTYHDSTSFRTTGAVLNSYWYVRFLRYRCDVAKYVFRLHLWTDWSHIHALKAWVLTLGSLILLWTRPHQQLAWILVHVHLGSIPQILHISFCDSNSGHTICSLRAMICKISRFISTCKQRLLQLPVTFTCKVRPI